MKGGMVEINDTRSRKWADLYISECVARQDSTYLRLRSLAPLSLGAFIITGRISFLFVIRASIYFQRHTALLSQFMNTPCELWFKLFSTVRAWSGIMNKGKAQWDLELNKITNHRQIKVIWRWNIANSFLCKECNSYSS